MKKRKLLLQLVPLAVTVPVFAITALAMTPNEKSPKELDPGFDNFDNFIKPKFEEEFTNMIENLLLQMNDLREKSDKSVKAGEDYQANLAKLIYYENLINYFNSIKSDIATEYNNKYGWNIIFPFVFTKNKQTKTGTVQYNGKTFKTVSIGRTAPTDYLPIVGDPENITYPEDSKLEINDKDSEGIIKILTKYFQQMLEQAQEIFLNPEDIPKYNKDTKLSPSVIENKDGKKEVVFKADPPSGYSSWEDYIRSKIIPRINEYDLSQNQEQTEQDQKELPPIAVPPDIDNLPIDQITVPTPEVDDISPGPVKQAAILNTSVENVTQIVPLLNPLKGRSFYNDHKVPSDYNQKMLEIKNKIPVIDRQISENAQKQTTADDAARKVLVAEQQQLVLQKSDVYKEMKKLSDENFFFYNPVNIRYNYIVDESIVNPDDTSPSRDVQLRVLLIDKVNLANNRTYSPKLTPTADVSFIDASSLKDSADQIQIEFTKLLESFALDDRLDYSQVPDPQLRTTVFNLVYAAVKLLNNDIFKEEVKKISYSPTADDATIREQRSSFKEQAAKLFTNSLYQYEIKTQDSLAQDVTWSFWQYLANTYTYIISGHPFVNAEGQLMESSKQLKQKMQDTTTPVEGLKSNIDSLRAFLTKYDIKMSEFNDGFTTLEQYAYQFKAKINNQFEEYNKIIALNAKVYNLLINIGKINNYIRRLHYQTDEPKEADEELNKEIIANFQSIKDAVIARQEPANNNFMIFGSSVLALALIYLISLVALVASRRKLNILKTKRIIILNTTLMTIITIVGIILLVLGVI